MSPVSQVRNSLWTPEGEVSTQKDVLPLNKLELVTLARMHEIAQKFGLSIVCRRCDSAILGKNADTDTTVAVSCRCRELRYTGS